MANSKKNKEQANQAANFEEAYNRLAETTTQLERGGLTLEQSLALYEEGVKLAQRCDELLAQAELRVSQLTPTTPTVSSSSSTSYSVNATRTYIFATDEDEDSDEDNEDEEDFDDEELRKALDDLQF